MKKILVGLMAGLAMAGGATFAALELMTAETAPSQVERHAAIETFYSELETLQARMRAVENPVVKDHLFGANFGYVGVSKMQVARNYPANDISYAPHDLGAAVLYPDLTAYADSYIGGLMAIRNDGFDPAEIALKKPFRYDFDTSVRWDSIDLVDGQSLTVLDQGATDTARPRAQQNQYDGINLFLGKGDSAADVTTARLTVEVTIPSHLHVLTFPAPQIGDTQTYDDFRITITDMTDRYAKVTAARIDGGAMTGSPLSVAVAARDQAGHPIAHTQQLSSHVDDADMILAAINDAIALYGATNVDDQIEQLFADGPNWVTHAVFLGPVGSLDIYVADKRLARTITRDLTLPALDLRSGTAVGADIPMPVPVIDNDLLMLTDGTPDVFTPREVKDNITIWQDRDTIDFALPPRVSDLFMDGERLQRQGALDFGRANRGISHDDWAVYSYQDMRIDFDPQEFSAPPQHVSGEVAITVLSGITRETYALDTLPDGIMVDGNRITVTGPMYNELMGAKDGSSGRPEGNRHSTLKVIALNADGQPLKRFHQAGHYFEGRKQADLYHHGNPAAVMLLLRGDTSEVIVPIDEQLDPAAFDLQYN